MIKATILLFVLTLIAHGICKIVGASMDVEEKLIATIHNEYPTRFIISVIAFYILLIAFAVCLIITIVTW